MGLETETQIVQVANSFNTTHIEYTLKNLCIIPHTNIFPFQPTKMSSVSIVFVI